MSDSHSFRLKEKKIKKKPGMVLLPEGKVQDDSESACSSSDPPSLSSSSSSDHTDRDGIHWGSTEGRKLAREHKNLHDSAVHMLTFNNDAVNLRKLLEKGLRV